jgi:hypothetical protein
MRDRHWNERVAFVSISRDLWDAGDWVHLRATWDVNQHEPFQIYLNGELLPTRSRFHAADGEATALQPFSAVDLTEIFIGAEDIQGDASADGVIDEVVISR